MRNSSGMDQAEGLRRLLVGNRTQVISLVSGKARVGSSSATLNLAAALARSGKDVLVLDENHTPNNLSTMLGLPARQDLLDVACGKCSLDQAALPAKGFHVLPAARAMAVLPDMSQAARQRLGESLVAACEGTDVVLIDAIAPPPANPEKFPRQSVSLPSLSGGSALLVIADATASGITESYALIKRLALESTREQFGVVLNNVADDQAARKAFENMAKVARLNLAARLDCLGYIPYDESVKRAARLHRTVVEAFPASPAAQAYLELAQEALCLPMPPDGENGGVHSILHGLINSLHHYSREMAHVVN